MVDLVTHLFDVIDIDRLESEVHALKSRVTEFERQIHRNNHNSSQPSSAYGLKKRPSPSGWTTRSSRGDVKDGGCAGCRQTPSGRVVCGLWRIAGYGDGRARTDNSAASLRHPADFVAPAQYGARILGLPRFSSSLQTATIHLRTRPTTKNILGVRPTLAP